jgi:diguanylate cyclase (GGDEF)-like protein/PAS domain S-box-containing protein
MKKQNILIVDDESTNVAILVEILEKKYNLLGATDGATALEIANSDENVDLLNALEALQISEERLRFALEGAGDGLWDWNIKTNEVYFSKRWKEMLGFGEDEIASNLDEWKNRVHPEDLDQVFADITAHIEGKSNTYHNEHRVKCQDGSYKWILDRGIIVSRTLDGTPTRIVGAHSDISQRKEMEKELIMFRTLLDHSSDAIEVLDAATLQYIDVNETSCHMLGYSRKELLSMNVRDIYLELSESQLKELVEVLENKGSTIFESTHQRKDGSLFPVEISISVVQTDKEYLVAVVRDITERKQGEAALYKSEQFLKETQKIAGLGSYTLDFRTGIWTRSDILDELFGIDTSYERSRAGWEALIHSDDRIKMNGYFTNEVLAKAQLFDQEYRIVRQDDQSVRWVHGLGKLEFDSNGIPLKIIGTIQDITEKKKAEAYIENLANFDQLTGLANRTMLNDRVTYLLNMAQRNNEPLTVMFLDLDNFKNINDSLGHTIGDHVLIEVAKRIKKTVREIDTVARLGGDEFIILFPNTDANAAMHIATKLIEKISKASIFEHNELTITPSIGIAIYPNDGEDFETLLRNADTAMYKVKNSGRKNFYFFTQEMQLNLARNLKLENALRHALKRNELELYYQPQISLSDGKIIGAEALLRWHHPELGMISPAEFIPIAESSGQIIEIGEWVLRTTIGQTKEWMDNGFAPMIIAVNISAIQFRQKNLLTLVTDILEKAQLPNEYLELELTEAVMMQDPESVITIMNKFHEQGIRMSIDDFGTGYSSLSYLKKFKVYKLKIEQSFIRDISNDPDDRAIVSAIIDMAKNLGLQTIAEGVETAEQLAFLRLRGCHEVQGYYFSKPLPSGEFEQFRHNHIEY